MKPLYFKLSSGTELKVIPDTSVYHDGHPIISFTYSLFRNQDGKGAALVDQEAYRNIVADYVNHPAYVGFITFEEPGKLFTYTSHGNEPLTMEEAEEAIEQISHIRDNPHLWPYA